MLPSMRQRLIIAAAALIGTLGWLAVSEPLRASDGTTGLSLTTAQIGFGWSVLLVALAGLPALAAGLVASAAGNPLAGVFAVSTALCVLAGQGGIHGWVFRHDAILPGDYAGLILEMFIWQGGLVIMVLVICYLVAPVRKWLPAVSFDKNRGANMEAGHDRIGSLAAVVLCALISGFCTFFFLRSTDAGQVIWSLILAFFAGSLVARMILPRSNPWCIVLSPAVVAVVGYAWVLTAFDTESFLAALYRIGLSATNLPGVSLALPIHYASAGVVGCTLGVGCAQSLGAPHVRLGGS